jgi:hypothetical protein
MAGAGPVDSATDRLAGVAALIHQGRSSPGSRHRDGCAVPAERPLTPRGSDGPVMCLLALVHAQGRARYGQHGSAGVR